jgi:putative addiction module killer protein
VEFSIEKTLQFTEWFEDQTEKIKGLIRARFSRIEVAGHFGVVNSVGDGVFELKWKIGLRVYFAYLDRKRIVVLYGGTKHGQKADIKKAKTLLG